MATREQLEAEIASINGRLTAGAEKVQYQDNAAWFDLDALRKRRRELERQLGALDGAQPRLRRGFVSTSKGL